MTTDKITVYKETLRSSEVLELLTKGNSPSAIAKQLQIPISNVYKYINDSLRQMSVDMQSRREMYEMVSFERLERLYGHVSKAIEHQAEIQPEVGPDPRLIKVGLEIIKTEQSVLQMGQKDGKKEDNRVLIQNTFVGESELYKTALAIAQENSVGYHVSQPADPMMVEPDSRLSELEDLARKFLPEGVFTNNDELDELGVDSE
jgi:hypothetical protein